MFVFELFFKIDFYLPHSNLIFFLFVLGCPTCKGFTPLLLSFYNEVKNHQHEIEDGKIDDNKEEEEEDQDELLEIVYVSMDQDYQGFEDYFSHMPW